MINMFNGWLFWGYMTFILVGVLSRLSPDSKLATLTQASLPDATLLVRIAGLVFSLIWMQQAWAGLLSSGNFVVANIYFGPYWPLIWLEVIVLTACTQLLWVRRLRLSWAFNLLLVLLVLDVLAVHLMEQAISRRIAAEYAVSWEIWKPIQWATILLNSSVGIVLFAGLLFLLRWMRGRRE